jgi:hypothetical protein
VRCAIYARKSTEEGLSQPFNSLDAQRESAEAYISSQRHMGWTALERRYEDGGYTGANLERPALRALMEDIESGQVDCVVVYKVDRLSRSLLDFARLIGAFEEHRVSLVSVTQQLNTTDSLGRLTVPTKNPKTRRGRIRHMPIGSVTGRLSIRSGPDCRTAQPVEARGRRRADCDLKQNGSWLRNAFSAQGHYSST